MKKKLMIGLIAGTAVFAAVFGAAASLNGINTEDLGADSTTVASCDSDGVTTSYTVAYDGTATAGYKVNSVTVDGINNACDGQTISVRSGSSEASMLIPTDAATSVTLGAGEGWTALLAENLADIHVLIQE